MHPAHSGWAACFASSRHRLAPVPSFQDSRPPLLKVTVCDSDHLGRAGMKQDHGGGVKLGVRGRSTENLFSVTSG